MPRSVCLTSSFSLSLSSCTISLNLSRENYRSLMSRGNTSFLLINFKLLPSNLFITSLRQCWKMSIKACQSDVTPVKRNKKLHRMTYNKVYFEKQQISERKVAVIRGFMCLRVTDRAWDAGMLYLSDNPICSAINHTHYWSCDGSALIKASWGNLCVQTRTQTGARTHIHTQTHKEKRTYFQFKHICTDLRTAVDERGGCAPNGSECLQALVINMTESLHNFLFFSPLTAHCTFKKHKINKLCHMRAKHNTNHRDIKQIAFLQRQKENNCWCQPLFLS